MTIRFDALLVRALAAEFAANYGGRAVTSVRLDSSGEVRLATGRRAGLRMLLSRRTCSFERLAGRRSEPPGLIPRGYQIAAVSAPPDERILIWTFTSDSAPALHLILELVRNRHNAFVTDSDHRIRAALFRSGASAQRAGDVWQPPPVSPRLGATAQVTQAEFESLLATVLPADRARILVASFAWTSPINAAALLGEAGTSTAPSALAAAYARYAHLTQPGLVEACVLGRGAGRQPYPVRLPGTSVEPMPDLITAFEKAMPGGAPADAAAAAAYWRVRRQRVEAKLERLRREAADAPADAAKLRHHAGLLLAQLDRVRRGDRSVTLDDFAGGRITLALDPGNPPADQANRLYAEARRRERAAARVPALIERAERERLRLSELESRAAAGDPGSAPPAQAVEKRAGRGRTAAMPYRRYRTSGGLEVRVGRSARANDDLTFHHSTPDDVWLHARNAGGAHVILRWSSREANPPASDLREAAILAAFHSRARTSGTVPVDWTRRKYVRKPRKAPPGSVAIEREATLFVSPDRRIEERLRVPEEEDDSG